jgi:hypothetical protein
LKNAHEPESKMHKDQRRLVKLVAPIFALIIASHFASAGLFDDVPKSRQQSEGTPATTQPSPASQPAGESAEDAYRDAVHKAKAEYLESLIAIDQRFLSQLDSARKTAVEGADDAEVRRIDARTEAINARLKEHQTALASVRSPARPTLVSARWGTGNKWIDVSDQIKRLAKRPDVVRADPDAVGWRKSLEIVYIQNGQKHTLWINEDQEIRVDDLIPAVPGGI